ncbi:MAG: hypothetical protein V4613_03580 [Bacteroidota bacterium]
MRSNNSYKGGKAGSGVYQNIINHLPEHDIFISAFAGHCGVTRNKKPSYITYLIDRSSSVIEYWKIQDSSVLLRHGDCLDIIPSLLKVSAGNDVLIYFDPPYLFDTRSHKRNIYEFEYSESDHLALIQYAISLNCNVCISHYPCEMYDVGLQGWNTHDFVAMTRSGLRTERIYMNYEKPVKLQDYSYIGSDYRERERYKRTTNNILNKFKRMDPLLKNSILQQLQNI